MSGRWIGAGRAAFVRDLVRDFCHVCMILSEQRERFSATGTISHAVLRDLLGREMRKGVFWRLKDTSHQLFRLPVVVPADGQDASCHVALWQFASGKTPGGMVRQGGIDGLLDWCIGYAFHECVKLKEDAFQRQHYANRLLQMRGRVGDCEGVLADLEPLTGQTRESIGREMTRILQVLHHARGLLLRYMCGEGDNGPLARWLVTEETLVRGVFGEQYDALMQALYAEAPGQLYLLAAQACLEGGRPQQALEMLDRWENAAQRNGAGAPDATENASTVVAGRLRELAETFDVTQPVRGNAG